MQIKRFYPEREFSGIGRFVDDIMNEIAGSITRQGSGVLFTPIDVKETSSAIEVCAELPGMSKEDIDIALENNTLILSGEKKEVNEEKEESYHLLERRYGSFKRVLNLPVSIDPDKVKANYKDGILTITIQKKEEAKAKQIKVEG